MSAFNLEKMPAANDTDYTPENAKKHLNELAVEVDLSLDDYLEKYREIQRAGVAQRNRYYNDNTDDIENFELNPLIVDMIRSEYHAVTDSLTGLFNKRYTEQVLEGQTLELQHQGGRAEDSIERGSTFVMYFDVNRFKEINDTHGHLVGDLALKHVASLLKSSFREKETTVARIGGDEFCIVAQNTSMPTLLQAAKRFTDALNTQPLIVNEGVEVPLEISIGIAPFDTTSQDTLKHADETMYRAKHNNGDERIWLYNAEKNEPYPYTPEEE